MPELALPSTLPPTLNRISLRDIQRPVQQELKAFQAYFRKEMEAKVLLINRIAHYILRHKGKQIRPLLVFLSAQTCGTIQDTTFQAAALVELLHTATLVHDDVVDGAERRRGVFSINALWKNKVAVLFGDYLLSRGLLLALRHQNYKLLHEVADAVRRMSEGELLQIEKARKLDIDEETYFQIIGDKTGSLIAACTTCGALSTTDNPEAITRMRIIGEKIGLAFQIRDDLFDYGVDDVGKPLGIDLQEKKMTLPLIYSLRQVTPQKKREIMRIVRKRKKNAQDIKYISQFVEEAGGLAYARKQMEQLAQEALTILEAFPPSEARTALSHLIAYIVQRKK